jgi:hypothetical protein
MTGLIHVKGIAAAAATGLFALDTVTAEPDVLRYAITQGGLFAVVLVLLWSIRRDYDRLKDGQTERISVLTDLVQQSTAAQTKSAESQASMARALEEMTRTIGHMSGRV